METTGEGNEPVGRMGLKLRQRTRAQDQLHKRIILDDFGARLLQYELHGDQAQEFESPG